MFFSEAPSWLAIVNNYYLFPTANLYNVEKLGIYIYIVLVRSHLDDVSQDFPDLRPNLTVETLRVGSGDLRGSPEISDVPFQLVRRIGGRHGTALAARHPALAEVIGLRMDGVQAEDQQQTEASERLTTSGQRGAHRLSIRSRCPGQTESLNIIRSDLLNFMTFLLNTCLFLCFIYSSMKCVITLTIV